MKRFAFLPLMALLAGAVLQAGPLTLGSNSLTNGDAESGTGSANGTTLVAVPGWTLTSNFIVNPYGLGSGFPAVTDPGPAVRGANYFAGGPSNGLSTAAQTLDATSLASLIDLGSVNFDLSGYLGGFSSQADNAVLTATFKNTGSSVIGTAAIGPVSAADRGNVTALLLRDVTGVIPVGTRSIDILLTMTRPDGDYNDGYADNLSFVANSTAVAPGVPEPAAMLLVAGGLGLLLAVRKLSFSRSR